MDNYQRMYTDDFQHSLEDMLLNDPEVVQAFYIHDGHSEEMHSGLTDEELIARSRKTRRPVSQILEYTPDDGSEPVDMNMIISSALLAKTEEIAEWRTGDYQPKLELEIPFDIPVFYGVMPGNFEKVSTPVVKMVLQWDKDNVPGGFHVTTCYGDIEHDLATYVRQMKCFQAGIDPFKDGKLAIPADRLDEMTMVVIPKKEVIKQIKAEQDELMMKAAERKQLRDDRLLDQFSEEFGIPRKDLSVKTDIDDHGHLADFITYKNRTKVGLIKKNAYRKIYSTIERVMNKVKEQEERNRCSNSRNVRYVGVFLDKDELEKKCQEIGAKHLSKIIENPHVTLAYDPINEQLEELKKHEGQEVTFLINRYGNNGKNEGFGICDTLENQEIKQLVNDTPSGVKHITLSIDGDRDSRTGKPVAAAKDTWQLFAGEGRKSSKKIKGFAITGKIGEFVREPGEKAHVEYEYLNKKEETKESNSKSICSVSLSERKEIASQETSVSEKKGNSRSERAEQTSKGGR